jgi:hypothetical protein
MQNADDQSPKPESAYRSRWQRFSPSMGWKAFWSEIVIVILGVLIALAANEAVQNWNWRHKVQIGETRLKPRVEVAFMQVAEIVVIVPCIDAQLAAIAANLLKDGNTLQPLPRYSDQIFSDFVVRYPDRLYELLVWDTLIADGTAMHFPDSRRQGFQRIHSQLSFLREANSSTGPARGRFAVMAYPLELDPVVRKDLLIEIEQQRSRFKDMAVVASTIVQQIDELQLAPESEQVDIWIQQESGTVKFCREHNLPQADWRDALKQ